jgi:riboflavin biosynthesis pyrimidine reductase
VVLAGADDVDAVRAMAALGERGHRLVLCEGGPTFLAHLAASGALDELCLTIAPLLAGAEGPRIVTGAALPVPRTMRLASLLEDDGYLLARYLLTG